MASDASHGIAVARFIGTPLLLLKIDTKKAHRRRELRPKDWRDLCASVGDHRHIITVGTYGVASAGLAW